MTNKMTDGNIPSEDWTIEKLKAYSLKHLGSITAFARKTAQETWLTGRALMMLQGKQKKGKGWMLCVDSLGISYGTANNLIKIGKCFDTLEEVEGWTVPEMKTYLGIYTSKDNTEPTVPIGNSKTRDVDRSILAGTIPPRDETPIEGKTSPDIDVEDEDIEQTFIEQFETAMEAISLLAADAGKTLKSRRLDFAKIETAMRDLQHLAEHASTSSLVA